MNEKQLTKLTSDKTEMIDKIVSALQSRVGEDQKELLRVIIEEYLDKFDTEDGRIRNTTRNKRLIALLDEVYGKYIGTTSLETLATMIDGVQKVVNFNTGYFKPLSSKTKLKPIDETVQETVNAWLGLNTKGGVSKNGYLDTLINDATIKNQIRNSMSNAVITQAGYQETKKNMSDYIVGADPEKVGALGRYYRNFVYDTFSHVDRAVGQMYADGLGFNYAIYEGGIIKTTRPFCFARNGKVFSRDEIAAFDPKTAKPPGYNPFIDLGGYGCRHHLNWIPDALALVLRPDLNAIEAMKEPEVKEVTEDKKEVKEDKPATGIPAADTDINALKPVKNPLYRPDTADKVLIDNARTGITMEDTVRAEVVKLADKNNSLVTLHRRAQTDEGRADIKARFEIANREVKEAKARLNRIQNENEVRALEFRDKLIAALEAGTVEITGSPTLEKSKDFTAKFNDATTFFKKMAAGYLDGQKISTVYSSKRAYYNDKKIHLSASSPARTIIHELAHALEEHNVVYKAAVDFLMKRTEGNPLRKLRELNQAYRKDEVYKEGGFINPYVGKIYKATTTRKYNNVSYTEVISMGIEKMYTNPLEFYIKDPEHFSLIYNLFIKK